MGVEANHKVKKNTRTLCSYCPKQKTGRLEHLEKPHAQKASGCQRTGAEAEFVCLYVCECMFLAGEGARRPL